MPGCDAAGTQKTRLKIGQGKQGIVLIKSNDSIVNDGHARYPFYAKATHERKRRQVLGLQAVCGLLPLRDSSGFAPLSPAGLFRIQLLQTGGHSSAVSLQFTIYRQIDFVRENCIFKKTASLHIWYVEGSIVCWRGKCQS